MQKLSEKCVTLYKCPTVCGNKIIVLVLIPKEKTKEQKTAAKSSNQVEYITYTINAKMAKIYCERDVYGL